MRIIVRRIAIIYGIWVLAWLGIALYGELFLPHVELQIAAHFYLTLSGLPAGLLSLNVMPNGTLLAGAIAGILGWAQWVVVAMLFKRWEYWRANQS